MKFEDIDRTIYHNLRKRLALDQLAVDVLLFPPGQEAAYKAAQVALGVSNGLGAVVGLYGVGQSEARDTKSDSKVVINRKDARPGEVGGAPELKYIPYVDDNGDPKWRRYKYWDRCYNVVYEIRTTAKKSAVDRAIQESITAALGAQKFIKFWNTQTLLFSNAEEDMIFLRLQQSTEVTSAEMIERVIRYEVTDVFISEMELLEENIPPLIEVGINIDPIEFNYPPDPADPDPGSCQPVRILNSDSTYDQTAASGSTHALPNVVHTDSDGSPVSRPGMVPFVATLCSGGGGPAPVDYYYAIAMGHP